jgi:tetratricopeptide (TPR) repeat protein
LPMVLFLVSDRYRLATWPVVALMAGSGLVGLYERVRQRRLVAALWVPLVGLLVSALPIDSRTEMSEAGCRYAEGNLYFEEERWEEARTAYEDVLKVWPDDMGAHSWLAYLAARRQDWPEAIAHGLVVGRQFPGHFPTWRDLAEWQLKAGDREGALISLRAAFSVPGDRTSTGVRIVKLLRAMERNAEVEEFLRQNPSVARHPKVQPGAEP